MTSRRELLMAGAAGLLSATDRQRDATEPHLAHACTHAIAVRRRIPLYPFHYSRCSRCTVVYREPRGPGPGARPGVDLPLQPEPERGAEPHRHHVA